MSQDRKLTEREIDDIVVAQADDPSAWEDEIPVQRKRWRVNPSRIELAAKFFVLSALHRIGANAALATGQSESVDAVVITPDGSTLTIQVKALTGSTRWRVQDIRAQRNHFVVFVCFVSEVHNPQVAPEVYVVDSNALRDLVERERLVEVQWSDLGERLNAREAWYQLAPATAA